MVVIAMLLVLCIVLISFVRTPQKIAFRIIFRSARDAPVDDPDFKTNPQRYFELYTMNSDGSDIKRITNNLYLEAQPDVSPDGEKIDYFTYAFETEGNTHRVRVANADESKEWVISTHPWESEPSWVVP